MTTLAQARHWPPKCQESFLRQHLPAALLRPYQRSCEERWQQVFHLWPHFGILGQVEDGHNGPIRSRLQQSLVFQKSASHSCRKHSCPKPCPNCKRHASFLGKIPHAVLDQGCRSAEEVMPCQRNRRAANVQEGIICERHEQLQSFCVHSPAEVSKSTHRNPNIHWGKLKN